MLCLIGLIICCLFIIFIVRKLTVEWYVVQPYEKKVLSKFNDAPQAAQKLQAIDVKTGQLIDTLWAAYKNTDPKGQDYILSYNLKHRWRPHRVKENDSKGPNDTSYTIEKGDLVALCLREKVTGSETMHDMHTVEFVNLHELAHIASDDYGHSRQFWLNFYWVLRNAKKFGFHQPRDYRKFPVNYCGLDVEYNPYYDPDLVNNQ